MQAFDTEIIVKESLQAIVNYTSIDSIQLNDHLKKDLQLDSMGSLLFLMKLEENIAHFRVDPDTLNMKDLETVQSVITYVEREIARNNHVH